MFFLFFRNNARYLWKRIPPAIKSVSSGPNLTQKPAVFVAQQCSLKIWGWKWVYTYGQCREYSSGLTLWGFFFFGHNRQMPNLVQFGRWDKGSGRGTSQESTQQSVHISGLRLSNQSWKHSEVQTEPVWGAGNCLELFLSAPTQINKSLIVKNQKRSGKLLASVCIGCK